jgi:hypothetical protein
VELLEHRRVAYGARGFHGFASFIGSISAISISAFQPSHAQVLANRRRATVLKC